MRTIIHNTKIASSFILFYFICESNNSSNQNNQMYRGRGSYNYQNRNYFNQNQNYQNQNNELFTDQEERTRGGNRRGNSRGRNNQRYYNNHYKNNYYKRNQNNNQKFENIDKKDVEQQKIQTTLKRLMIDELLKEESIFSIKHKENQRTIHENERIIATDNYSTHALSMAAVAEYKYIVDLVPAKERVFCEMWSCADHVYMRNQQLQMYLSTQEELITLANEYPSIYNVYHGNGINQSDDVRNELQQLKGTKEFFKVFLNYLPTKDRNGNTQMLLPYRYRHGNGNVININNNGLEYEINNNNGLVNATSYVKDAEAHNWQHFVINDNERVRRYDPMAVQQFIYDHTYANQQLQGAPPAPGNVSFQQSEFDAQTFNQLFGCYLLNNAYNKQKTSHTQNRFVPQQYNHGVFYYDQVMKFRKVLESFPEVNEKLSELSFKKEDVGIIRREPFKPVLWGVQPNGNEEGTFVVQGSSTLHVLSPFMFYTQQDAQAWGGFYLRVGQGTYGHGDINLYVTENVGSYKYQLKTRVSFVNGLEKIFKKEKDEAFSSTLVADM